MTARHERNGTNFPKSPPLVLEWTSERLPQRAVRLNGRAARLSFGEGAPPHLPTGPPAEPFDFCAHVRRLCAAIVRHCPEFRHVDVDRILFAVTQARTGRSHGLQAKVTPLRFPRGELVRRHRTTCYQVQRFRLDGRELLYVMTFCLPRFLNLDFDEKFVTLFHELFHIGPDFDGDLRRHNGRCHVHTHSQKKYDEQMGHLARTYLGNGADPKVHAFMRLSFAQLKQKHGGVVGVTVPRPKLLPVQSPSEY